MAAEETHRKWLLDAIDLSKQCPKSSSSFAVGAIIIDEHGAFVSSGYSLELGPATHAEENAIQKASQEGICLEGLTIYCSLEPCSVRKSRPWSCTDLIIEHGLGRVFFALKEPPVFVNGQGTAKLRDQGIMVECWPELGPLVESINQHLL